MRSSPGEMLVSTPRLRVVALVLPNGGGRSSEMPARSVVARSSTARPVPALGMSSTALQGASPSSRPRSPGSPGGGLSVRPRSSSQVASIRRVTLPSIDRRAACAGSGDAPMTTRSGSPSQIAESASDSIAPPRNAMVPFTASAPCPRPGPSMRLSTRAISPSTAVVRPSPLSGRVSRRSRLASPRTA